MTGKATCQLKKKQKMFLQVMFLAQKNNNKKALAQQLMRVSMKNESHLLPPR